jgi:diguanylate cyclase (GGDEF)-like protein/PAS domain S-box-containing protein
MTIERFTSLRTKMLLALSLGMVLLFTLTFIVARTEILQGYSKLEKDKTIIQVNSAIGLLNEQPDQLSSVVRDYAHWDDLYQYVAKPTPAFIESSFADSMFSNIKINAVFIIDSQGKVLHKKSIDYLSGKPWHIPTILEQAVSKGGSLIDPSVSSSSGFFWTPEGICIISAFDILDTSTQKPRRGTLIMVRLLNKPLLQHIEKILGTKLTVEAMRKYEDTAVSRALIKAGTAVLTLNDNQVAGFGLINTVGSNTKLVLNTVSDRKIFEQGQSSLKFLYWGSLLLALLLTGFSWLLDRLVISRLAHLSDNVLRIGQSATTSGRVEELSGNDEMAKLAHGINGMLVRLDESQHALEIEKERTQVTLTSIADAVITSDMNGYVTYMNTAAERLTGINSNNASGKALKDLLHLVTEDKTTVIDSTWLTDNTSALDEVLLHRTDGQQFVISKSASPLHDINGMPFGTVIVLHDVTTLHNLANQLSYQARYDSLTGLVNRYEFDRKAQAAIEDAQTSDRVHCLAYIDLDKFKLVNDSCGHMAGDLFLKQLSGHLKTKLRSADTFARLGGDEFALMLMGCNLLKAQEIVEDVLQTVLAYRFTYEDKVFRVGASIGLTEISAKHSLNLSELLATTDAACYAAKRNGGNRVNVSHLKPLKTDK